LALLGAAAPYTSMNLARAVPSTSSASFCVSATLRALLARCQHLHGRQRLLAVRLEARAPRAARDGGRREVSARSERPIVHATCVIMLVTLR
jgi:hypothetical protein